MVKDHLKIFDPLIKIILLILLQIRAGRLQRAVVARAGRHDARPPVVPAAARAGADAALPHGGRARVDPPHPTAGTTDTIGCDKLSLTLMTFVMLLPCNIFTHQDLRNILAAELMAEITYPRAELQLTIGDGIMLPRPIDLEN